MEHEEKELQILSASIIVDIARCKSSDVDYLIRMGVIEKLIPLLYSPHEKVWSQAVLAYLNISGDRAATRDLVLVQERITSRIIFLTEEQTTILNWSSLSTSTDEQSNNNEERLENIRNLAWVIKNCCDRKPIPIFSYTKQFVPTLMLLLESSSSDEDILLYTFHAISRLTEIPEMEIDELLTTGCISLMFEIYQRNNKVESLRYYISLVCNNLVAGNEHRISFVIHDLNGIELLYDNLAWKYSTDRFSSQYSIDTRRKACRALSNICAGTHEQVKKVVEHSHLLSLLSKMMNTSSYEIVDEIVWIIGNISQYSDFIGRLIEFDCGHQMITLLETRHSYLLNANMMNIKFFSTCLDTIYHIGHFLQEDRLNIDAFEDFKEFLEEHGRLHRRLSTATVNLQVRARALQILLSFFTDEIDETRGNDQRNLINEG